MKEGTLEFAIGLPIWRPPALGLLERDADYFKAWAWVPLRRAWCKGGELILSSDSTRFEGAHYSLFRNWFLKRRAADQYRAKLNASMV